MSLLGIFVLITFYSHLEIQHVDAEYHENPSETCTVKEFGSLEEVMSYSVSMMNVYQEGDFPLKVKPPYDFQHNCYYISRAHVKVYNPTNKPKIGLKYLDRPVIYAYVLYGLWMNFVSNVEVKAFSFPSLSCGEDVIDDSPWGRRNSTPGGENRIWKGKKKGIGNTGDDTRRRRIRSRSWRNNYY